MPKESRFVAFRETAIGGILTWTRFVDVIGGLGLIFDHFVCFNQHMLRDHNANLLRCLQIDENLELFR